MNGKRIFKTVAAAMVATCVLAFSADSVLAGQGRDGGWRDGSSSRYSTPWGQGGSTFGRSGFSTFSGWDRGRGYDRPMTFAPPRVVHRPPVVVAPPRHDCYQPVFVERPVHQPSWGSIGLNIVINILR